MTEKHNKEIEEILKRFEGELPTVDAYRLGRGIYNVLQAKECRSKELSVYMAILYFKRVLGDHIEDMNSFQQEFIADFATDKDPLRTLCVYCVDFSAAIRSLWVGASAEDIALGFNRGY